METYLIPLAIAAVSAILRWFTDLTCSSHSATCRASSEVLHHIYMVVFFFLLIVGATKAQQIKQILTRFRTALEVMSDGSSKNTKND
jgi:atlastin